MMIAIRAVLTATVVISAAITMPVSASNAQERPIKALLVTGGCCHDYDRQKLILPQGISARADVEWTVVHQGGSSTNSEIPLYQDPNWADGFDVIVHNECFADAKDPAWVDRVLKPHREGKPAVLIHCAMHCYRTGSDAWFEFCGLQSPGHGPHYSYQVDSLKPDHPIMNGFGTQWTVPKGELYHALKIFPSAVPLAKANRQDNQEPQVCVWTNDYHGTRVFATTIGHYNETMAQPTYLDMVARGLLWAVHGDRFPAIRKTTKEQDESILGLVAKELAPAAPVAAKCCNQGNLVFGKATRASSEETGKNNFSKHAVDGDLRTRWCAANGSVDQWISIDLGEPKALKTIRLYWEQGNNAYQYRIEGSLDANTWSSLVDASANQEPKGVVTHEFAPQKVQHVRVTYLGSKSGGWGSIWEIEASDESLPEVAKAADQGSGSVATVGDVEAPDGFEVRMFAAPPQVGYPVCIAAAATGEVFVGVDEQGSLGKETGRGRILKCVDTDGDGQADRINTFATVDHPRGLIYDNGSLWVLHPPSMTVFHDRNGDGVAEDQQVLLTGISTQQVAERGADHTTNGIRMGIDGWIYIAVGDFGFVNATGTDGRSLSRRGGGIVRIRPDGTDMEVYSWGQRNILDVCIDPYLDMFTRDNTNDGGGWNVRVTHILQGANYGYPSRYMNYAEETMPPMADYGGGSGCGAMYVFEPRWPKGYGDAALTCDWGTSQVYRHQPKPDGATFAPDQDTFLKLPRPTDIDIDGSGRMYVSSWKNGGFNFSDPNVGFVVQVTPRDFLPKPFPAVARLRDPELLQWMRSGNSVHALTVQREWLRRTPNVDRVNLLLGLIRDTTAPLAGRVAAIFTLKQMVGAEANDSLAEVATRDANLRRFALRAMTDRMSQLDRVPESLLVQSLGDPEPKVQSQALISLARLGAAGKITQPEIVTSAILPLTVIRAADGQERKDPVSHDKADAARVIPHLAVRALRDIGSVAGCVQAASGPYRRGALWALRDMHSPATIDGLIALLQNTREASQRMELLDALARLYFREGEYTKGDWWGTRPDTRGPYYDRAPWDATARIGEVLTNAMNSSSGNDLAAIRSIIERYQIPLGGDDASAPKMTRDNDQPIVIPKADPNNPNQIANIAEDKVATRALQAKGDPRAGKTLFTSQSCVQCHTDANGQTPKGPHLVDIGKRYKRGELIESILKPSAKLAQGFDSWAIVTASGKVHTGFVVLESAETVILRQADGRAVEIPQDEIEERKKQEQSMMPTGLVAALTPEQLADLLAYLESLH